MKNKQVINSGEFPVFKTIKLGTHKSANALRSSLIDDRNYIENWDRYGSNTIEITLAKSETEITLHVATVEELTGTGLVCAHVINSAIRSKGYDLCPAEVGPQLRLQYPDQPNDEILQIAMEPIAGGPTKQYCFYWEGRLNIFSVNRLNDRRYLSVSYVCNFNLECEVKFHWDCRFVFASRK